MRFGTRRGVSLVIALAALAAGGTARGNDPFHHTIPREVEAIDLNTGGPYYAPPIPYGHYAKEGLLGKCCGKLLGLGHGLGGLGLGHGCHACNACGGKGCGLCGGKGTICGDEGAAGHGLGLGHGHGQGFGHGAGDPGCSGPGCGGLGHGLGHGKRFDNCGLCGGKGCEICTSTILPSSQAAPGRATTVPVAATSQVPAASSQACGLSGCGFKGLHKHHGRGICAHDPGLSCGGCAGDPGHGHGLGLGRGCLHGPGGMCDNCRGNGGHGKGCGFCGGKGCRNCLGLLKGHLYGLLHPHAGEIEYFVGPGGPVPLTPGYVPWVNPVRSPRDFFAFPPFVQ